MVLSVGKSAVVYNVLCKFEIDIKEQGCISFFEEELIARRYTLCERFGLRREI
jgi:hypothetical protein